MKFKLYLGDRDIGYRKGDLVNNGEETMKITSSPFSRWRRFLRFTGINTSFEYNVKLIG